MIIACREIKSEKTNVKLLWMLGKGKQSNQQSVSLFEKNIFCIFYIRWQRQSVWYVAENWTVDASLLRASSWRRQYSLGGGPGGAISALSGRTDAPTEHRVTFISSQMLALLVKQIKTTSPQCWCSCPYQGWKPTEQTVYTTCHWQQGCRRLQDCVLYYWMINFFFKIPDENRTLALQTNI